jgi:hypothetical protein
MVRTVAASFPVSAQLLGPTVFVDLDGKQASMDDLIADDMRASLGMERLFRFPPPAPYEEPERCPHCGHVYDDDD